jgi:hypothetical protein
MPFQPRSSNPSAAPFASASLFVSKSVSKPQASILFLGCWLADLTLATLLFTVISVAAARAQEPITPVNDNSHHAASPSTLPFEVSNPKHKKWPEIEAGRIYTLACELLARSIRPEHPPQLRPKFRLVLGTDHDEFVRDSSIEELHLRSWDPEKFAQGVVVVALRDLVPRPDLARLARLSVTLAGSTVDVSDLRSH